MKFEDVWCDLLQSWNRLTVFGFARQLVSHRRRDACKPMMGVYFLKYSVAFGVPFAYVGALETHGERRCDGVSLSTGSSSLCKCFVCTKGAFSSVM